MMMVEITGIAKGGKIPRGQDRRSLEAWVNTAREVGWCKGMPAPLAVERVATPADVKAKAAACFDEVLCVMWWPQI